MIPLHDDNPTRTTPVLTWLLLALNIAVYLLQAFGGMYQTRYGLGGPLAGWTVIPVEITQGIDLRVNGPTLDPTWLTVFTAMFMHGGLLHLAGNMVFLVIFGNNIEDALGRVKYLLFYLLSGIAATVVQIMAGPNSIVPMLGASGAIAGVLGAYLVLYPRARVHTLVFLGFFITTVRLPAFLLLGFWIISQFFSQWTESLKSVPGQESGGVAYLAHIGGFVAGMILIKIMGAHPHPLPRDGYDPYDGPGGYPGNGGARGRFTYRPAQRYRGNDY